MIAQLLKISKTKPLKKHLTTKEWAKDYYQLVRDKSPSDKAILGGFTCQQFSFTFLAGYQAALEKMFPTIAPNELKALCISEEKGGHPKAMQTTLTDNKINGLKTYITAGSDVVHLLVLCKTNEIVNGRSILKMVHIPSNAPNTTISNFELPFMKDIKHGKLALNNTSITDNQILNGDGYTQYTKPFRTLEDVCIGLAYQAMLLRQAIDYDWDEVVRDQLLLSIFTLKNLLQLPPSDKETHLLLTANEEGFKKLLPLIESNIEKHCPSAFKKDWVTNKRIITLGDKIKTIRLSKARESIFG